VKAPRRGENLRRGKTCSSLIKGMDGAVNIGKKLTEVKLKATEPGAKLPEENPLSSDQIWV